MIEGIFSLELLFSALRMSVPLAFASLGGVYSERGGVVNIALEGIMLMGAFGAVVGTYFTNNPWIGLLVAMLFGLIIALIHAVVSITFRINQIISGTALNMMATGLTTFLSRLIFQAAGSSPHIEGMIQWQFPGTSFKISPLIVIMILAVILSQIIIFKTRYGLRLRACGENPYAADSLGIDVIKIRYSGVIMSGILGGLGGAYLSLEHARVFVEGMTTGRGFIALAGMIFGRWTPVGSFSACFLFGLAEALRMRLEGFGIPTQFIQMIPYLVTMGVLIGVVGRAVAPAYDGIPFEK
ncbi:MAG: ABC transporter permease [Dictyoglomi bacterium]|nr:ABC transporter permease [Dictyoglomota bacterium]